MDYTADHIEKDLVSLVLKRVKEGSLSGEDAQKICTQLIGFLSIQDKVELLSKLKDMGETYQEAQEIYEKYRGLDTEKKQNAKIDTLSALIQAGKIDQALEVAKGE